MLVPTCKIELEPFEAFGFATEIVVESSVKTLTDTATIKLPRNVRLRRANLRETLRPGARVRLETGYGGENGAKFSGFVARTVPSVPFEIHCEDAMWKLKQTTITRAWKRATLRRVLTEILPPEMENFVAADVELGDFRADGQSVAQILFRLQKDAGLHSRILEDGRLWTGLPYLSEQSSPSVPIVFHFQRNVVSSNLEYRSESSRLIKVKAVSLLPNGRKLSVEVGDPDGETRTLHFYDARSEADLRRKAENETSKMKSEGYTGSFTAFGVPVVRVGDTVELRDDEFTERRGNYVVESVKRTYGTGGYRQEISLGYRVN